MTDDNRDDLLKGTFDQLGAWIAHLLGFRRKTEMDAHLDDETRFHLEMATEQRRRAGLDPDEARRTALIAFGGGSSRA